MTPLGSGPSRPCAQAEALITEARDPQVTFVRLSHIRVELQSMNCPGCVGALDTEVKFRSLLATTCHSDMPSPDLAVRITETLKSIDLSAVDVNDIEF